MHQYFENKVIGLHDNRLFKSMVVLIFLLLVLFAFSTTLGDTTRKALLSEDGPVEIASAVLYFVCCAYVLLKGGFGFFQRFPYLVVIPMLFGMRELDFDKRFTTIGVLKSKFYVSPLVPLHTKLLVVALGLVVIALILLMLKRHFADFWDGVRNRTAFGWGMLLVLAMLVVSKSLDGLERKCTSLGVAVSPLIAKYSSVAEEIIELGIPVMMLLLFSHYFNQSKQVSQE